MTRMYEFILDDLIVMFTEYKVCDGDLQCKKHRYWD